MSAPAGKSDNPVINAGDYQVELTHAEPALIK
jgi:hypothetical protein